MEQADWQRVDAVVAGIERLEERNAAELHEELEADLRDHDQRLADLRASGSDTLAYQIASDEQLQHLLDGMRAFVENRV